MEFIPVKIPVKPYIRAFLEFHFGKDYSLSLDDWLGIMLYHILKKQQNLYADFNHRYNESVFTDRYVVLISGQKFFHEGVNEMTPISVIHFNKMVDNIIKHNFYTWVTKKIEKPTTKKAAILEFLDCNGITEESITEDAFIKAFNRWKKQSHRLSINLSSFPGGCS